MFVDTDLGRHNRIDASLRPTRSRLVRVIGLALPTGKFLLIRKNVRRFSGHHTRFTADESVFEEEKRFCESRIVDATRALQDSALLHVPIPSFHSSLAVCARQRRTDRPAGGDYGDIESVRRKGPSRWTSHILDFSHGVRFWIFSRRSRREADRHELGHHVAIPGESPQEVSSPTAGVTRRRPSG